MDNLTGKRLDGRYELQEIIGVGGMAVVYKAYDNIEDRTVAVKILKEEFVANEDFLRRFKNESKAISVLSHPNIVKVYDVSFGDILQYIVMEYIDGFTLKEYIEQQGNLTWKEAIHFTIQILKGLQHAHDKGIVHRDVKPQNIILCSDGSIKVTDFGIARFARSEHKTMTDKAIGSVHYISPEQARGEPTDEKADIYSVGVMLYEMLTGRLPFQAESAVSVAIMQLQTEPQLPREINGSIPVGLEQITMHAMQKDQTKRYQMAAEMLRDLEEFKRDPAMTFSYNYFVDSSPTRYVSTDEEGEEIDDDVIETRAKPKGAGVPVLFGIAAAFIVVLIGLVVFFAPQLFGSTGGTFKCPDLVGVHYEDLKKDEYKDFKIEVTLWESNNDQEYGYIFSQDPAPGKQIKKNKQISVKVSTGKKTMRVPDVYGLDVNTAILTLRNEGFTVEQAEVQDEDIAKGCIVKTHPIRGDNVAEGTTITVYVSVGEPEIYVDIPNVLGKSEEVARQLILEKGLTIGTVSKVASTSPDGYVVSQDPDPKTTAQAAKGTAINFSISNGDKPESVEPVRAYELNVSLPDDYKEDVCTLTLWVGDKQVASSKSFNLADRTSYTLTVSSEKEKETVLVKLNDDNYAEFEIDFENGKATRMKTYDYPKAGSTTSPKPSTSGGDITSGGDTTTTSDYE